jgi:hypothetical protein
MVASWRTRECRSYAWIRKERSSNAERQFPADWGQSRGAEQRSDWFWIGSVPEERDFWFAGLGADLKPEFQVQLARALPIFSRFAVTAGADGTFFLAGSTSAGARLIEVRKGRRQAETAVPIALASGDVWITRTDTGLLMIGRTGKESPGSRRILESISVIKIRRSPASP